MSRANAMGQWDRFGFVMSTSPNIENSLQKASIVTFSIQLAKRKLCGVATKDKQTIQTNMTTARETVNRFYDVCNNQQGDGFSSLVADDIKFEGPVMRLSGADEYAAAVGPLLKFHKGMK